jgi:WD40 repeat protein
MTTADKATAQPSPSARWRAGDPASDLQLALLALAGRPIPDAEVLLHLALGRERLMTVYRGHTDWVTSASISPDGALVLTEGLDGTVRTWETSEGRQRASYDLGVPSRAFSGRSTFSPDGKLALVVGADDRMRIIPMESATPDASAITMDVRVNRAAWGSDGNLVATGPDDSIREFTSSDWQNPRSLPGLPGAEGIGSVAVSRDGQWVAVGGSKGAVSLRRRQSSEPMVLAGHAAYVYVVAFSPDGRRLVSASDDGTARLFSVPDGAEVADLKGHTSVINGAAFSPDGQLVVTASSDKTARVFSASDGRLVTVLSGHSDEVEDAEFSPDGQLVATASVDGTARVWYARTGQTLLELRGHAGPVLTAAFTPDGKSVVTASADSTARLWDVRTGQVFWGNDKPLRGAVFDSTGRFVLTASQDAARVFDTATGRLIAKLPVQLPAGSEITDAVFSPDGRSVAVSSSDKSAVVLTWNTPGEYASPPARRRQLHHETAAYDPGVNSVAFSRDGRWLVTTTRHEARVWDTGTGVAHHRVTLPQEELATNAFATFLSAVFSPDGQRLLIPQFDTKARLWDVNTGKPVLSLQGLTGVVYGATFSRDGRQIVTASADGTARVWNAEDGRQLQVLTSPVGQLRNAALSPDGRQVAGGTIDGSTVVWDVGSGRVLAVLHEHADLVTSVEFSPDGEYILTASDDQTAKAYPYEYCRSLDELITIARQRDLVVTDFAPNGLSATVADRPTLTMMPSPMIPGSSDRWPPFDHG